MGRLEYAALLTACLLVTLPLEFIFDARVYRRIGRLGRALALPLLAFWAVDSLALVRGLWAYSRRFTIGWIVPHKLPIEEIAFFVVVPLCAILTFETATSVYDGRVVAPWTQRRRRRGAAGSEAENGQNGQNGQNGHDGHDSDGGRG